MSSKMKWYNALPIKYKLSNIKCKTCGGECIETPPGEENKLYACTNDECKTGFFKYTKE